LRTEWIENPERLAELRGPWDSLAGLEVQPWARHGWFSAWWSAFGAGRRLRTCAIWDGQRLVACLPAFATRGGLAAMVNAETPQFSPPAAGAAELQRLAGVCVSDVRTLLTAQAVESRGAFAAALGRAAERGGGRLVALPWQTSPIVDIRDTFEEYRQSTRPKWLARLARYRRQMERRHRLELVIAECPTELEPILSDGLRVEGSGWKGREGTAILSAPETEAFYRDVTAMLWRSGELRLSMLRLDGRPVAFDLAFEHGARLYSLKTGYDEEYRKIVPGLVLRLSLIEHCFELGLEAHELLGAEMEWKRNFATSAREHLAVRCYPRRLAGLGGALVYERLLPVAARVHHRLRGAIRRGRESP
jgi:CelD/BcsL family acetyltransferase involved in cellulose biosynthesis